MAVRQVGGASAGLVAQRGQVAAEPVGVDRGDCEHHDGAGGEEGSGAGSMCPRAIITAVSANTVTAAVVRARVRARKIRPPGRMVTARTASGNVTARRAAAAIHMSMLRW
jgi:hypothetical protein